LGAIVTVVVGNKPRERDIDFYEQLLDEGIEIYYNDKVHAKVILVEGKDGENSALIMSANLTTTGLHYKYEVGVFLSSLEDKSYKKLRAYTSQIVGAPIKTKPIEWVM
jgi:phosphatidylserine/phosphatidylglycerophosphate/cardiolipin synthase-like enzyme